MPRFSRARLLTLVALLSSACSTMAPTHVASEVPSTFRVTLQDADADQPADETGALTDDDAPDTVALTMPQDANASLAPQDDGWEFAVAPYIWGTSMKGKGTIQGASADIDESFSDIIKNTDIGAMLITEARQGDTVFSLDQDYLSVSTSDKPGNLKVNTSSTLYTAMITAGQVFGEGSEAPVVYVGARYWYLDAKVKVRSGGTTLARGSGSKDWVDPIIGARKRWELGGPWGIVALGNFGGFGIGTASDSVWGATVMATRTSEGGGQFLAGWRHLAVRKNQGSGDKEFKFNIRFTGPIFGWAFRF